MSKTRSFQVIAGIHYHSDSKVYKTGEIVHSADDLSTRFVGKFKEVEYVHVPSPAAKSAPKSDDAPSAAEFIAVESGLGTDVSDKFPSALEADYRVFQKGKKFFVAEPPKFEDALNSKGLLEAEVADFITDLIG